MEAIPQTPNAKAGALERLFDSMVDGVYGYAVVRVGRTEAEEITSEVFCAASAMFERGEGERVTEAWLMAVVRNKVVDQWRAQARRSAKSHLLRTEAQVAAAQRWDDNVDTEHALIALDSVDEFSRLLLVLRYIEGHAVGEIAARIGRSTTATASALARARRKLRRAYERLDQNS